MTRERRRSRLPLLLVVAIFIAASCSDSEEGSVGNGSDEGGRTLVIANVQPFSGTNAAYGPEQHAGCISAVNIINEAGGVLGNDLSCLEVDTRSNPTDAVPAVQQMLATEENLVGVVGPSSDEAAATIPLLNEAGIPYWPDTGDPRYNQQESDTYWRLAISDDLIGLALALWADESGYESVAIFAGNDEGSQPVLPSLRSALGVLGIDLVADESVALGQSSYRSEANTVAQASPDAIIIPTTDPQTVSTFLGELFELYEPIPIIGQVPPLQPRFSKAIKGAIGGDAAYDELYDSVHQYSPPDQPARAAYQETLMASGDEIDDPGQWAEDPYSMAVYDAVMIMSFAMLSADSTDPEEFNSHILGVTEAGSGKTAVQTWEEGKAAFEAGEEIQYVGALGEIAFSEYHNVGGQFIVTRAAGDQEEELGLITGDQITEIQNQI
ncbi:MAG: ABC transporter substrate-binding protein [Actinomycetota bacterium]